jgi:hypothetical protein
VDDEKDQDHGVEGILLVGGFLARR